MNPNPDATSSCNGTSGVYFAESSEVTTFDCWSCGKKNQIVRRFRAEKI